MRNKRHRLGVEGDAEGGEDGNKRKYKLFHTLVDDWLICMLIIFGCDELWSGAGKKKETPSAALARKMAGSPPQS
ncbi:MAG: hypothetical protein HFJ93_01015 [Muribaculaceae bacterium]|nr:hypothetical protein [Muribaculaceae bacterium]